MAPQLIRLAQELARDNKTLQSLSMDRTTASYKLRDGLGETIHEKIVRELHQVYISMNVECMSNAYEIFFSITVSDFSDGLNSKISPNCYPSAQRLLKSESKQKVRRV